MAATWASTVEQRTLKLRAELLRDIRQFFNDRGVLEVTTPSLGAAGVSDLHLNNLTLAVAGQTGFLQTSPEYAMKRLLAGGSGAIYELGPAFREGESGRRHHFEFTMLEWYRPGFSLAETVAETEALLTELLPGMPGLQRLEYKTVFEKFTGINPHTATIARLQQVVRECGVDDSHMDFHDDTGCLGDYLDLLFSSLVEPHLSHKVVVDFPVCQAALARLKDNSAGETVAVRFEMFIRGMEITNGYDELGDSGELRHRFDLNNELRARRHLPQIAPDEKLLAALPYMPRCSGVAMGFDRVLMIRADLDDIRRVIHFTRDFGCD